MNAQKVATVTINLVVEPGGPRATVADAVAWVEALLEGREFEGFNTLRYSRARIVSASVVDT